MYSEHQSGMDCGEFEALLSDVLDGTASEPVMARFQAHAAVCPDCSPMLAGARAGMSWLKSLAEVEPPRNLVRNILIATSAAEAAPARQVAPAMPWRSRMRGWMRPLAPVFSAVLQPRFALSLGMAFFSITVLLNAAGLHLTSLHASDLTPSAIQANLSRTYNETSGRVVKYYENIRLVYEIESRVREIRDATREQDEQQQQRQQERKDKKYRDDNTSGQPKQKQERYSRQNEPVILADTPLRELVHPILQRRDA